MDKLIVVTSASKTFNLACLLNSHIIIPNEDMRKIYNDYVNTISKTELSLLGMVAAEAAYKYGADWLDGLLKTLKRNYDYIKNELNEKVPDIIISPLEGTYLPFIDLREVVNPDRVKEFIQDDCKIAVDFGEWFSKDYKGFIRLNIAASFEYIKIFTDNVILQLKTKNYK